MMNILGAVHSIAEQRIAEAQKRGDFEGLPGEGRPLAEEDVSNIPEELRMAYRILKNAGYCPPELAVRKEIHQLCDLLENSPEEKNRLQAMKRARVLLNRIGSQHHAALEAHDEYYLKVLALLEKHERMGRPD